VASKNAATSINHDRVGKAKLSDAIGDLPYLLRRVLPWVSGMRNQHRRMQVHDPEIVKPAVFW